MLVTLFIILQNKKIQTTDTTVPKYPIEGGFLIQ